MPPRIQQRFSFSPHLSLLRPHRIPPSAAASASSFTFSSTTALPRRRHYSSQNPKTNTNTNTDSDSDADTPPQPSFYKTHGRAFFKCFTLAFFTYQLVYYSWLTLESEYTRDEKEREIRGLEAEVRLLDDGRRAHRGG